MPASLNTNWLVRMMFVLVMSSLLSETSIAQSGIEDAVNRGKLGDVRELAKSASPSEKVAALDRAIRVPASVEGDFTAMVESLLESGAEVEARHIFMAVAFHGHNGHRKADNIETLALLLRAASKRGISVDSKLPDNLTVLERDRKGIRSEMLGVTPLAYAFIRFNGVGKLYPGNVSLTFVPFIQQLLDAGADPDATDQKNNTLDSLVTPRSEEVRGYTGEAKSMLEGLLKLDNQAREKLRELLKVYRIKKAEQKLRDLDR